MTAIGKPVIRQEANSKVTGGALYTDDFPARGILTAKLKTSTQAHARILGIDVSRALAVPGVKAILTGESYFVLCGPVIRDRPPLAAKKVRYYGEPVALVVAESEAAADRAVFFIEVQYEPLPVLFSPSEAIAPGAVLLHETLGQYPLSLQDVYPEPGTNICERVKIRKGMLQAGFAQSDVVVEAKFQLPQSDHLALETRAARAKIDADGVVTVKTASQSPFEVKNMLCTLFSLDPGKVIVEVPLVGGGFGGKSPVTLEILAYLASRAVGGREVRLVNSREADLGAFPCKMGLEATLKIGAARDGTLKAAEMTYLVDTGAYADIGPRLAKAIAVDCTGPYQIENVSCDALCVYTNHIYATAFRGFAHSCLTFCVERVMDKLAARLEMDPSDLRMRNAIRPGQRSPTGVKLTESNLGMLPACISQAKAMIGWGRAAPKSEDGKIRAMGMACLWKTSNSPPDAQSGVLITCNQDGSLNLNCGCVECGPGMKTAAAQILAEAMHMGPGRIHVNLDVNTQYTPEHWKTVASMTTYLMGNAILRAAEDLRRQLTRLAATALRRSPEELAVAKERVYVKQDPAVYLPFEKLVHGYSYANGNAVGGPILGRGGFVMPDLNYLDRETGTGKSGPAWTVGAQAVEVEYDPREHTYRLVQAVTVLDAGKVINPRLAEGLVKGGMNMGLSLASREAFVYDPEGRMQTTSLRTYKVMHFGQTPRYRAAFVETPQADAPFGARGIGEHGTIGMPAALAGALSKASGAELDRLPLTPETIWRIKTGGTT